MKNYTVQYLKAVVKKYPYEYEIKNRMKKIYNPDNLFVDENSGYSASNVKVSLVERTAIKIADDYDLNVFMAYRDAIDKVLDKFGNESRKIIAMRFFDSQTIKDVANELQIPLSRVKNDGEKFLEKLASELQLLQ